MYASLPLQDGCCGVRAAVECWVPGLVAGLLRCRTCQRAGMLSFRPGRCSCLGMLPAINDLDARTCCAPIDLPPSLEPTRLSSRCATFHGAKVTGQICTPRDARSPGLCLYCFASADSTLSVAHACAATSQASADSWLYHRKVGGACYHLTRSTTTLTSYLGIDQNGLQCARSRCHGRMALVCEEAILHCQACSGHRQCTTSLADAADRYTANSCT